MCRNIRTLHNFAPAASDDEVPAAALQYVRKIAGTTKPSKANQEAFDRAVHEIADVVRRDPAVAHDFVRARIERDDTVEDAGKWR